ncbi:MAG: IS5 family transposase [Chloroflexi bacterium]|nr:IS5 family transposase [Chloroflexota bacterium]
MSVDGLGNPLQFQLTAGQAHDLTQAEALLPPTLIGYVIADKGYDADACVQVIQERGAVPVIPPRSNRKTPRQYDAHRYKERHLAECFINKIKHYRRIFSRYDKLAHTYLGFLHFVSTRTWLR